MSKIIYIVEASSPGGVERSCANYDSETDALNEWLRLWFCHGYRNVTVRTEKREQNQIPDSVRAALIRS